MKLRALALGATVGVGALATVGAAAPAQASGGPSIALSTTTMVPGQTVVISGTGWPVFSSVVATLCGADAVTGTADCAVTETATMVATHHGLLYSRFAVVAPPAPCPCVMLLTSDSGNFTKTIPVTVVGQPTAPVRPRTLAPVAEPRISGFTVTGPTTVGSLLGAPAARTLTMQLDNPSRTTVTPVLVGRWGRSGDVTTVIRMPRLDPLRPRQRVTVRVPFQLTALSVGTYVVRVQVQLVGYPKPLVVSTTTSQWPIALFVIVIVMIGVVILGFVRRRRRRGAEEEETSSLGALGAEAALSTSPPAEGPRGTAEVSERASPEGPTANGAIPDPVERVVAD